MNKYRAQRIVAGLKPGMKILLSGEEHTFLSTTEDVYAFDPSKESLQVEAHPGGDTKRRPILVSLGITIHMKRDDLIKALMEEGNEQLPGEKDVETSEVG